MKSIKQRVSVLLLYVFSLDSTALAAVRPLALVPQPTAVATAPAAWAASEGDPTPAEAAASTHEVAGSPASVQASVVPPATVVPPELLDLRAWTVEGDPLATGWEVAKDGLSVERQGSATSFLASPLPYVNATLRARVKVGPGATSATRIGFVLGHRHPLRANGDEPGRLDLVLLDWHPRSGRPDSVGGIGLYSVNSRGAEAGDVLRGHSAGTVALSSKDEDGLGWVTGREHEVEVRYRRSRVVVLVDGAKVLDHEGRFEDGRLGLYASGPGTVVFRDVTAVVSNVAPVADAGQDQVVDAGPGCVSLVSLDGSGSSDPDGDVLTYSWSGPFGTVAGMKPEVSLGRGVHVITLTVDDGNGLTASDTVEVEVVDRQAPQIACPAPVVVPTGGSGCTATGVELGAPVVTDNCAIASVGAQAPVEYPLGTTMVSWSATDEAGYLSSCWQTVTVLDANVPALTASVAQTQLWPPNHSLVDVGLQFSASDPCGGTPLVHLKVFADEPENNQTGDGNQWPDAVITAPRLDLRKERRGDADGRVYLLLLTAKDEAGNTTTVCRTSVVPKSQSKKDVAAVQSQAQAATTYCEAHAAAPDGYFQLAEGDLTHVNLAPRVGAGPDQTILAPANRVVLEGTVTDDGLPAGAPVTAAWTLVSGPAPVTFTSPGTPRTEVELSAPGSYLLRLSASDTALTGSDDVVVTLLGPNRAPQVSAGEDRTLAAAGGSVLLAGAVSDDGLPLGSTVTQFWSVVSGPGTVTFADPTATSTQATFSVLGTYVLQLVATDGELTGSDQMLVLPPNAAPVVDAGPDQQLTLPADTVTLAGTVVDDGLPPGGGLAIRWSVVSGPAAVGLGSPDQVVTTARFTEPGTYVLQLAAGDSALTTTDTVSVEVIQPLARLSVADVEIVEGSGGLTEAVLALTLSRALPVEGSVDFVTVPGTATEGCDYLFGAGTVRFAPGETEKTVHVSVVGDLAPEPGEAFVVRLGNPVSILLEREEATVSIVDDDEVNAAPSAPGNRTPADGAWTVLHPTLSWTSADPDPGDGPVFDVYLGESFGTDGQTWRRACATGPSPRSFAATAYDDASDRLLVFGGRTEGGESADLWTLRNATGAGAAPAWVASSASGPAARRGAVAAFDPGTRRLIVHGGCEGDCTAALGDTWALDGSDTDNAAWTALPDSPAGRVGHAAAYDSASGRLIVFGGATGEQGTETAEVLILSGADGQGSPAWQVLGTGGGPVPRRDATAVYDPAANRLLVFGGRDASGAALGDLWALSHANGTGGEAEWTEISSAGSAPAPRFGHATGFDAGSGRMLVFGGTTAGEASNENFVFSDAWLLTGTDGGGTTWVRLDAGTAPAGRYGLAGAYSTSQNRLVVALGANNKVADPLDDAWVLQDAIGSLPLVSEGQSGASHAPASLTEGGRYHWRVVARDGHGAMAGSPAWAFTPRRPEVTVTDVSVAEGDSGSTPAVFELHLSHAGEEEVRVEYLTVDGTAKGGQDYVSTSGVVIFPAGSTSAEAQVEVLGDTAFEADEGFTLLLTSVQNATLAAAQATGTILNDDPQTNAAPLVNAGPNQQITGRTTTLGGTVTDDGLPKGASLSTAWTLVSGPGLATIADSSAVVSAVTFGAPGSYVLRLSASDGELEGRDEVALAVTLPANQPPVVDAGPDRSTSPGTALLLDGRVTDDGLPAGHAPEVSWRKLSGPGEVVFDSPAAASTHARFDVLGTYVIELAANDSELSGSDTVQVTVAASGNQAPVVDAGPDRLVARLAPLAGRLLVHGDKWTFIDDAFVARPDETTRLARNLASWLTRGKPGRFLAYSWEYGPRFAAALRAAGHQWTNSTSLPFTLQTLQQYDAVFLSGRLVDLAVLAQYVEAGGSVFLQGGFNTGAQWNDFLAAYGLQFGSAVNVRTWVRVSSSHPVFEDVPVIVLGVVDQVLEIDGASPFAETAALWNSTPITGAYDEMGAMLDGEVTDDGLPLGGTLTSMWTAVAGPGPVLFGQPSSAVTSAHFPQSGTYVVRLAASDTALSASDEATIYVNDAPSVSIVVPDHVQPGQEVTFHGEVGDDGLPLGSSLTWRWEAISGPAPVTIPDPTALTWSLLPTVPGTYSFRLVASDGHQLGVAEATVRVTHVVYGGDGGWRYQIVPASAPNGFEQPDFDDSAFSVGVSPFGVLGSLYCPLDPGVKTGWPVYTDILARYAFYVADPSLDLTLGVAIDNDVQAWVNGVDVSGGVKTHGFCASRDSYVFVVPAAVLHEGWNVLAVRGHDYGSVSYLDVDLKPRLVTPGTAPPVVDAGPDQEARLGSRVTLAGTVWDDGLPSQTVLTAFWAQVSGPAAAVLETPNGATMGIFRFPAPGTYVMRLVASDTQFTASDEVTVVVTAGNGSPVVEAGPDQEVTLPVRTVSLSGTVTDDGQPGPVTISWTTVSGPSAAVFSTPNQASTDATFGDAGVYVLALTADDSELQATDTVTVRVNPSAGPNAAPEVEAGEPVSAAISGNLLRNGGGEERGSEGEPVGWTGTSGDWSLAPTTEPLMGQRVLQAPGAASAELRQDIDVSALPAGHPLSLVARIRSAEEPEPDRCRLILEYRNASGGPLGAIDSGLLGSPQGWMELTDRRATPAGTASVRLRLLAERRSGETTDCAWDGVSLRAEGLALARLQGTVLDDGLPVGAVVERTWTTVSGPGQVLLGSPTADSTGAAFPAAGSYTLRLTATDTELTAFDETSVTIDPANTGPQVAAGPDASLTLPGDTLALAGTAADPDGGPDALTVRWTQVGGPAGASFDDPGQAATSVHFPSAGTYVLRLQADDGDVLASDEVTVVVYPGAGDNQPPVVSAGPSRVLTLPASTTTLEGSVSDDGLPAGATLTVSWEMVSGPGPVQFASPASPATSATFPGAGTYILRLSASDTEYTSFAEVTVTVAEEGSDNQAPYVSAGPDLVVPLATGATLAGTAVDDGRPAGGVLTVQWSQVSGQAGVVFGAPAQVSTSATFPAAGNYVLRLTATDGALTSTDDVAVRVYTANAPPAVSAGANQTISFPGQKTVTLAGSVSDDGLPVGGTLQVAWTAVNPPAPVAFSSPSSPATTVTVSQPGTYVLRLQAFDGELTASADATLTVEAGNTPPVVNAGPDQALTLPQLTATLAGTVTDDGQPAGGALKATWKQAGGPVGVTFADVSQPATTVSFDGPGTYVLRLSATDGALGASDDVTVTVAGEQPAGDAPVVTITAPADGAVVTAPTEVTGTVASDTLLRWRLETRARKDSTWRTLAMGQAEVAGHLGDLDPSMLLNGLHELRLTATDRAGRQASHTIAIVLRDNLKVGPFSVTFTDLEVPLSGIPIRISRSYDSRDKGQGDFGYGWRMDISSVDLAETGTAGADWVGSTTPGYFPQYCLSPGRSHLVTLTLPGGKVLEFEATPSPECQPYVPPDLVTVTYRPRPGTLGTLVPVGTSEAYVIGSFAGGQQTSGLQLFNADTFTLFDPAAYRYTSPEGLSYVVHQAAGVQELKDLHGNVLTVTPAGITHSSGRGVPFARDAAGRVTKITDPDGKEIHYGYDGSGDLVSVTDRESNETTFTYEAAFPHHLKEIKDPLGRTPIRNEYYEDGRIKSHTDAFGKTITYAHDLAGRQEVVTDRNGGIRVLHYDDRGNVIKEVQPDGRQVLRTFDARNNRLSETESHDPATSSPPATVYTYDAADNVTSAKDPAGNRTEHTYNARRQVLTTKDARGKLTENTYDAQGNLLGTKDATGNVTSYAYDARGNLLSQTATLDGVAVVTRHEYDGYGNLTKDTDSTGHETTYLHDGRGNRLSQTTARTTPQGPETLTTTYEHDGNGRLLKTTEADGSFTRTVYDELGRQKESYDRAGRKTAYEYDAMGRLTRTTYPDTTTEESGYDAEGRRTSSKDRAGRTTGYEYDPAGRLTKTTFPDSTFTRSVYDAAGRLVESVDARGKSSFYEYDAAGRRWKTRDPLGNETVFGYDAAGNQTTVKDPRGNTTTHVYDDLNRRVKTIFPDGTFTETAYDSLGRRTAETDQARKTTRFGYDDLGRLVKVTDALSQETVYGYDELGNRTSQRDANSHETRFEYDKLGRETARILPDGKRETKQYDVAGNLSVRTDFMGRQTTYEYDASNRLAARRYPSGPPVEITYTATGRRETVTDGRGVTTYGYDQRDRLSSILYPDGRRLDFTHDGNGSRLGLVATIPGLAPLTTGYSYDDAGRLDLVTDPLGRMYDHGYNANGSRTSLLYPNGTQTAYTYDDLNRLTQLTTTHPALGRTIQGYTLTLGPAGNRTRIEEADGHVREYGYDDLYRLTGETVTLGGLLFYQKAFVYDAVGNRLSQTTSGAGAPGTPTAPGTVNYGYDDRDRITAEGAQAYGWDDNGNLTSKTVEATYTWDFENRLTRVEKTDGTVIAHVYDADGVRVQTSTTLPGETTLVTDYLVDTSGSLSHVVAETDGAGLLKAYYVRGDDLLAVMRPDVAAPGGWASRFFHADHIGSIRRLTDEAGNTTDGYDTTAFGELIAHTGTDPQPYLFAGEPYDPNVGFQYHRARWMDPRVGRFASGDPFEGSVREPLTLHRFHYAAADPINKTDPSGEFLDTGSALTTAAASTTIRAMSTVTWGKVLAVAALGGVAGGMALGPLAALHEMERRSLPRDLYAFGNRSQPRGPRLSDFDGPTADTDTVGPELGPVFHGMSTYADPASAPLSGHYHRLAAFTMPPGLGVVADGEEYGGAEPTTHHTIYPTFAMSFSAFRELTLGLPWVWAGRKD